MAKTPDRGDALENLRVWKRALDLMVDCYDLTERLPRRESRRLIDQLERSSSAISANIAEGHGRARPKEFLRSLDIARGELREVQTHLESIARLRYLPDADLESARKAAEDVAKMISGLRNRIMRRHNLEE